MNNLVDNIIAANQRIKAVHGGVRETPLDDSGIFSERTGASFLLKGEHLQRTGSFKMRGAMNKVLCLTEEERKAGIITASSGNHGMPPPRRPGWADSKSPFICRNPCPR